jgi:hypothetical protein
MNEHIAQLMDRLKALEAELEAEFAKNRAELRFGIEKGRVLFEQEILRRHRELQTGLRSYIFHARPLIVLTAPVIYAMIVPLVLLDIAVTIYQAVCFRAYGIPRVSRADYFVFDRGHLAYLNALEKLNCAYCSYANGLIAYVREIAGRTEQYWCPIKHARRTIGAHAYYREFVDYGDAEAYRERLADMEKLRVQMQATKAPATKD